MRRQLDRIQHRHPIRLLGFCNAELSLEEGDSSFRICQSLAFRRGADHRTAAHHPRAKSNDAMKSRLATPLKHPDVCSGRCRRHASFTSLLIRTLSDGRCDLFPTWWVERSALIEEIGPGPSGSTNCCDVGSSFTCRGLNECVASGGVDAMSLGYEPLFVDFFRMAEVKPSSRPAYTSASRSRMRSTSTPSPSPHKPSSAR